LQSLKQHRKLIETQSDVGVLKFCEEGFSEIIARKQIVKKASDSKIN
jgi:hypothetical protein